MISGRRSDIDIIGGILEVAEGGVKKTEIVYRVNLNHSLLKKYLSTLVEKELITEVTDGGIKLYMVTEKGLKLLDAIKKVKNYLK